MKYVLISIVLLLSSKVDSQTFNQMTPVSTFYSGPSICYRPSFHEYQEYVLYKIDENCTFKEFQFIANKGTDKLEIALNFAIYNIDGSQIVSYLSDSYVNPTLISNNKFCFTINLKKIVNLKKGQYYFAFNFIAIPRKILRTNWSFDGYLCEDNFNISSKSLPTYFYHTGVAGENLPAKIPIKILENVNDEANKYFRVSKYTIVAIKLL